MNSSTSSSRTRSIAFIGLSIALIAVSAWVTVPIGPIPFTLQMLSISFLIYALRPLQAIAAVYGYVLLGALGVPVFSGMRGGIGVILGPTGGFIDGYLIGVPLAVGLLCLVQNARDKKLVKEANVETAKSSVDVVENVSFSMGAAGTEAVNTLPSMHGNSYEAHKTTLVGTIRNCGWGIIAGLVFVICAYTVGVIQYTFVAGVGVEVALAACVIPFVIPDIVKVILGVACAQAVNSALNLKGNA